MDGELPGLLAASELFRQLPEPVLRSCVGGFRPATYQAGQMIFARGDRGGHLLLVASGRIRLAVVSSAGRELSFRVAARGDIIGEVAALDGGTRSADAVALTRVAAYTLDRVALQALLAGEPALASCVIEALCRRLRDTSDQLESIALHSVEVRLARFLLLSLRGERAPAPGERVPIEMSLSQGELAQLLGASRPKVNVALRMLEGSGAVSRRTDRLYCDPEKLERIAEGDGA